MVTPSSSALLRPLYSRAAFPLGVGAVAVSLQLAGTPARTLLQFDREALARGELWRAITGNLVHLTWSHLLLNLMGLALIWALFAPVLRTRAWAGAGLASALAVSLGLWLFDPAVLWYVGLSGVLHGWFAAGAVAALRRGERSFALALLVLAAKLIWEQWQGPLAQSAVLTGGTVIVSAHLYGALGGLAAGLLSRPEA